MAEALTVVGAIASTIQLIDFTVKVVDRLNGYIQHLDEVPETLREIKLYLPLFIDALQRIQMLTDFGCFNPSTSEVLNDLIHESYSQMVLLDNLLLKITPDQGDSVLKRSQKALFSLKDEKSLKKIFKNVSGYIEKLLLFQTSVNSSAAMLQTRSLLVMHQNSGTLPSPVTPPAIPAETAVVGHIADTVTTSQVNARLRSMSNYHNRNKSRRISSFLSLSRIGLLWALQADLNLSWGTKGVSIVPSLRFQQSAKSNSPGFEILSSHYGGDDVHLKTESVCQSLMGMFRTGVDSPHNVFPDGLTWLEELLECFTWMTYHSDRIVLILRVLYQCGAPMNTNTPLILLAAQCNRYGSHLPILRELIALGYDCSVDLSSSGCLYDSIFNDLETAACLWPLRDEMEPFLLKFIAECSKVTYGAWGQTPLMDAALSGSLEDIHKLMKDPQCLQGRNLLGQSPVHVAILRPKVLSILLQVCEDLDIADHGGKTPLDYAAAYGCSESLFLLLENGAQPVRNQHVYFFRQAFIWGQWELMTNAMTFLKTRRSFPARYLQNGINNLMIAACSQNEIAMKLTSEIFDKLLELGVDKHLIVEEGDTLMHRALSARNAVTLFAKGFEYIEATNSRGWTALMSSIDRRRGEVTEAILERDGNVHYQDSLGLSPLHLASSIGFEMRPGWGNHAMIESFVSPSLRCLARLIAQGADPLCRDKCRCACSYGGCSPILHLLVRARANLEDPEYGKSNYQWVLEWLLTLSELQGTAIARKVLLELLRLREFHRAEMTHVCRESSGGRFMESEEIDEILDEERYLISDLDCTMKHWEQKLDDLPIEETWLGIANEFRFVEKEPIILPSEDLESSLCTDEHSERDSHIAPVNSNRAVTSREYLHWVEFVYKYREAYDCPIQVNQEWYEKRKYWANRQIEVLGDPQTPKSCYRCKSY